MKRSFARILVIAAVLGLSVSAFAGSKKVKISEEVNFAGAKLAAGEYKISVDESGNATVSQGKEIMATAKVKAVEQKVAARGNTIVTESNGKGAPSVVRFQFEDSKTAFVLTEADQTRSGN